MTGFDPRITAARPDLAASHLRGQIEATRYTDGEAMRVIKSCTQLFAEPRSDGSIQTELLFGETVTVLEQSSEGWSWGQSKRDGYVGYLLSDHLLPSDQVVTHRLGVLRSFVYPTASIKHMPLDALSFGSEVTITGQQDRFSRLEQGGFIITDHLTEAGFKGNDPARFAGLFLHSPYLWGGRSGLGLDCSALIQLSLQACGFVCPRDSDMQERELGKKLASNSDLCRNDLIFWKGHVGLMLDETTLLHASGHHMLVVKEPLAEARARILEKTGHDLTSCKRIAL